jgi:hypothetical protein
MTTGCLICYAVLRYAMQCCALCVAAMLCMLPVEIELEVQGLHDLDGTVVSDGARDLHG